MTKIISTFTTTSDGNVAFHVGDDPLNVETNRKIIAQKLGFENETLRYMNQVHGNNVEVVTSSSQACIDDCDGIITTEKNLALMVMVADCIPILLKDTTKGVIAAVHAGRNSTFQKIVQVTIEKMQKEFGCDSHDIEVELGPSIQKCCYEVSPELAQIVETSFGKEFVSGRLIDLQGINKKQCNDMGVTKIKISTVCTKCSQEPYYSYRLDKNTGRFAGIIMMQEE